MASVLIVDDAPDKVDEIKRIIAAAGVAREDIHVAGTGIEARDHLSKRQFDFLVLDIAIPLRHSDEIDRKGGINLLAEMVEGRALYCATHVHALTGFDDLKHEFESRFNAGAWTIDYYDASDIGWKQRLSARTEYILRAIKQKDEGYKTDLCVVTALESPELDAIRSVSWKWSEVEAFDNVSFFYKGHYLSSGKQYSVAAIAAPRIGMVAAATIATKIILSLRPQLLAMIGICAGVPRETNIGDCLVASPTWDWQMGKYAKSTFQHAPDQIAAAVEIEQRFAQLKRNRQLLFQIAESFQGNKTERTPDILIGPVASGSVVLGDPGVLESIQLQHRKLLGVDMELYGVFSAARDCSGKRPRVLGLKGVCDHADQYKEDKFQRFAAHMSAHVLREFAERYSHELCAPC